MEGWYQWKSLVGKGFVGVGCIFLITQGLRAEMAGGVASLSIKEERKVLSQPARRWTGCAGEVPRSDSNSPARGDDRVQGLSWQRSWDEIREAVTGSVMETMMTMFFIRWGSPPPALGNPQGNGSDPTQITGGGTPLPPSGQGDFPSVDPEIPPPPVANAPEPSSMVIALVGAGLAWIVWRKRRKHMSLEVKSV